jgi:prepilin-type processing-associated H-X9-DG protein
MKLHIKAPGNNGWSRFELLFVFLLVLFIFCLILAMLIPPRMGENRREPNRSQRFQCVSNLRQVVLALRIWEGDNNNQYPMHVSVANRGAMELLADGNVAGCFQVASNELSTPRILVCPADTGRVPAKNFTSDFDNSHISYFLCPDATETYPQMILSGDDNLAVNGDPVGPGVVDLATNLPVTWTAARHVHAGNIGFADGSVQEASNLGLRNALQYAVQGTPFTTNRLAIP